MPRVWRCGIFVPMGRLWIYISAAVFVAALFAGALVARLVWVHQLTSAGPLQTPATVLVQPGGGTSAIARNLQAVGVIDDARVFRLAVRLMGMDSRLKAGEYEFQPGISLREVVTKLAEGDVRSRSVTFPEGWTVKEIVARLEATEGLVGKAPRPAEGSLFPDTYAFGFGMERARLIGIMKDRMKEEVNRAWNGRDTTLPLKTPEELVNLASIVQKEAASEAEMPRIAAVFINRLHKGMRLQSDPTVIYGADGYTGDIRHKDLHDENPFNTYVYAGLPPTPISNPGRAALQAVARPAASDELFFVADADGSGHVFSRTYEEHLKHVKELVKARPVAKTTVAAGGAEAVSLTAGGKLQPTEKKKP